MMYNVVEKSENNFSIFLIFKILNGLQKPWTAVQKKPELNGRPIVSYTVNT
jgi:hypothetical protein